MTETDCWAEWLATRRYGGDAELRKKFVGQVGQFRDQVLDNAALAEGETLLDVGCGEGLIGFGAALLPITQCIKRYMVACGEFFLRQSKRAP